MSVGFNSYLVTFGKTQRRGSIFAPINCDWTWLQFESVINGIYEVSTHLNDLSWSDDLSRLTASAINEVGQTVNVDVYLDKETSSFYIDPGSPGLVVEISPRCESEMVKLTLHKSVYTGEATYYISDIGPTLWSCRRTDWVVVANKYRSKWDNIEDYEYYGDRKILLANDDALAVLERLCNFYLQEDRGIPLERFIACTGEN